MSSSDPYGWVPKAVLGTAIAVIVVLLLLFGDRENPYQETRSRLNALEAPVRAYAAEYGKPPTTLDDLSLPPEALVDHLGEPFRYEVDGPRVTLTSYGSDKKPGGILFKKDVTVSFEWE